MTGTDSGDYFLGHSDAEIERLAQQSAFYRDATEALLKSAGLAPGMRVLDIGSGAGDVSLLAAEMVGPSGAVLGIDRTVAAVNAARRRVAALEIKHITFAVAELESFVADVPFDALIGRFLLMYLPDPAATLRLLFRSLKSGAVIAFLEMEMRSARGYPDAPLFGRCIDWYSAAIELAGFRSNMGSRLLITFQAAGLPTPHVIASSRVEGGPDSPGYDLMAANLRTMLPMLERHKMTTAAEVDLATLAERLRRETVEGRRCLQFPLVMGAHARLSK
jgi:ubiquinone/menaquinone biosynthesis C-methylase UbiE